MAPLIEDRTPYTYNPLSEAQIEALNKMLPREELYLIAPESLWGVSGRDLMRHDFATPSPKDHHTPDNQRHAFWRAWYTTGDPYDKESIYYPTDIFY